MPASFKTSCLSLKYTHARTQTHLYFYINMHNPGLSHQNDILAICFSVQTPNIILYHYAFLHIPSSQGIHIIHVEWKSLLLLKKIECGQNVDGRRYDIRVYGHMYNVYSDMNVHMRKSSLKKTARKSAPIAITLTKFLGVFVCAVYLQSTFVFGPTYEDTHTCIRREHNHVFQFVLYSFLYVQKKMLLYCTCGALLLIPLGILFVCSPPSVVNNML